MARFRARRWILWGLLFLPVLAVPIAFVLGRAFVNDRLQRDLTFGKLHLHMAAPRLGWDLGFTADSVSLSSPAFTARAGRLRAEVRFWQSLVSLNPSFKAVADTVRVDLAEKPKRKGPRVLRLRAPKPSAFPTLRIPVPFRLEADQVTVARGGRPLIRVSEAAAYSQGPKGAAVEWYGTTAYPGAGDSAFALPGSFRASARWFGKWLRYQARFQAANGDAFRVEGEKRKADLRRGQDSLEISVESLAHYGRFFRQGRAPEITGLQALKAAASLGTDKTLSAHVRVDARVPTLRRLGPQQVALRLSFEDSSGRLVADSKGEEGQAGHIQGQFRLPLVDSLAVATLPSLVSGTFSGFTRNVRFPIARWVLPGDVEIRRLSLAGGEIHADLRSRDSSEVKVRIFRDSGIAGRSGLPGTGDRSGPSGVGSPAPWRLTFTGQASPTETWARIWTKNHVNYKSAALKGEFRPGELTVEVRGKQVTAYGSAADSLWARNVVRRRGYYLEDSRLYWKDQVWPVKGRVEWSDRKAVRGPRGLRMRRDVALSFASRHPRHGTLEFAMPRRRYMVVTAGKLASEHLPVPRLEKALPFHPLVDGRFEWDWEARTGETGVRTYVVYGGKQLALDLEAGWDARTLRIPLFEAVYEGSRLRLGADLRLGGRQFHQVRKLRLADVQSLSLEAERFEAAYLATLLPGPGILEGGTLDGRLAYVDTTGFHGIYTVRGLQLKPLRKHMEIPYLAMAGNGRNLVLTARTSSQKYPFLNDTLALKVEDLLGEVPGLSLHAFSAGGLVFTFLGRSPGFKSLQGTYSAAGTVILPGGAGTLQDFRLTGGLSAPLDKGFLPRLRVDSTVVEGRYAVQGLDTQTFRGEVEMREGRLVIPSLTSEDGHGRALKGEAEARLGKPLRFSARLRGEALALRVQGLQQLVFRDVEAVVEGDSSGLTASAKASRTSFQSARGAVASRGDLENLYVTYAKPRAAANGREPVPRLGVKARLRNFHLNHKIGFRQIQRFFRTVKVDKRRKRIKPIDLDIAVDAVGAENRVETDFLRMFFSGEMAVRGVYPYTMLSGEVSALSGEVGQTSQSYDIAELALKWQNATMEEGRVYVEGAKKLKVDCRPETQRTCNVFIKLEGRLDEMNFTYDSDCGQTLGGEVIEPAALINSVSRGCYSGDYVSGAGGGGYGEAVFTFLEPAISENLTRGVSKVSAGWIKSTQVSGIGAVVSQDTAIHAEPISVSVETKEWKGVRGMAKAGYHPETKLQSPWENKVAAEWRLPLEKVAVDSGWKRRVRDRVTLEASVETRPDEKLSSEEEVDVRQQVGLRYRYRFWNLW